MAHLLIREDDATEEIGRAIGIAVFHHMEHNPEARLRTLFQVFRHATNRLKWLAAHKSGGKDHGRSDSGSPSETTG